MHKNELRVFYNDTTKDEYRDGLVVSRINKEGKKTKEELIPRQKGDKWLICPIHCSQLNENQYFIYGRSRFRDKFGVLKLD